MIRVRLRTTMPVLKIYICVFLLIYPATTLMERESSLKAMVHKALRATARQCMQKVNATEHDLEYLRKEPPFPEKASCILSCLMERIGVVKENRYSKNGFMVAISPLVFGNSKKMEHMHQVAENCDKEINHGPPSNCQLGNDIVSCIYKYAPELHFKS